MGAEQAAGHLAPVPAADRPARSELDHMQNLARLADKHAADWQRALDDVPQGKIRGRVKPWAENYRLDALGLTSKVKAQETGSES